MNSNNNNNMMMMSSAPSVLQNRQAVADMVNDWKTEEEDEEEDDDDRPFLTTDRMTKALRQELDELRAKNNIVQVSISLSICLSICLSTTYLSSTQHSYGAISCIINTALRCSSLYVL